MKKLLDAIEKRRSLRSYTGESLEKWQIDNIIKAFMYAPSAMNYRPCHLIAVQDREMLEKLSKVTPWAKMVEKSALTLIILADPEKSKWWIEDCSAANENALIEVADMDLGACWVQVRDIAGEMEPEKKLRELLRIPENLRVLNMIAVGVPKKYKERHSEKEVDRERVHMEKF